MCSPAGSVPRLQALFSSWFIIRLREQLSGASRRICTALRQKLRVPSVGIAILGDEDDSTRAFAWARTTLNAPLSSEGASCELTILEREAGRDR
jgi:hypothetical protein